MKLNKLCIVLFVILSTLIACSGEQIVDHSVEKNDSPAGLWRQLGYGRILELSDSTIKVYDLNEMHCALTFEEDILDFARVHGVENDTLILIHGIDQWKCVRLDKLPDLCNLEPLEANTDPLFNYDVFWHDFAEHYCSFEIKNIDWSEVNELYRKKINDQSSELELYMIFEEIIALLHDDHVGMSVPDHLEEQYEVEVERAPVKYNMLDVFETSEALALLYVDSLRSFNAGMTRWGMIGDNVGFVQINSMLMQAHYDLDEGLTLQEFEQPYWVENVFPKKDEVHRQEEADGMKATLDNVLTEMPNAEAFIIDLRFNTGGKDGVAMEIVNHFSTKEGKMASKKVYENGHFPSGQDIVNMPSTKGFNGPVVILTSHMTASAAELTVLCSFADSNFTRVGSTTEGIFSSTLDKVLPNGWEYELSNEVYLDINGINYEHVGISPEINIQYPENRDLFIDMLKADIEAGKDSAIEKALGELDEAGKIAEHESERPEN